MPRWTAVVIGIVAGVVCVLSAIGRGEPQIASAGGGPRGASPGVPPGMTSANLPVMAVGNGAISGVVTDRTTREPVVGVVVTATNRAVAPAPSVKMITDSKGRFVFRQLPASTRFELSTTLAGFFDGGYGKRLGQGAFTDIALADGQWFSDAAIEMSRPGVIAGAVLDEHSEPIVGAYVRALQEIRISGRTQYGVGQTVVTDDRGFYRLANLAPGRYVVFVPSVQMSVPTSTPATALSRLTPLAVANWENSGKGVPAYTDPGLHVDPDNRLVLGLYTTPPASKDGRPMTYAPTFHPGVTNVARAAVVELDAAADRLGVDVRLEPQPAARLSGVVQGGGPNLPRFTLRLMAAGQEGFGRGGETATALVDGDGKFVFLNVPPGDYIIDARGSMLDFNLDAGNSPRLPEQPGSIPGFGSSGTVDVGPPGTGLRIDATSVGEKYFGRLNVTTDGRDVANLVVSLRPTVAVEGRLVYAGQGPAPGSPLGMRLEPANGDPALGAPSNNLYRDDPGAFRFEGLLPGEYIFRAPSFGASPWLVKSVTSGGRDYTNTPFDASAGRDFDDVVVTFTDQPATIRGAVREPGGALASSAAVIVFPAERAQWSRYGLRPDRIKTARVSSSNLFELTKLPAGEYFVVAVGENQERAWQEPAFLEAAARVATRVTLNWGESKNVDVTKAVVR